MTETKHTPGPWHVVKNSLGCACHVRAGERIFGGFSCDPLGGLHPHHDKDARLIAAAPDLLALCMEAAEVLEQYAPGYTVLLASLDAAIAKATGGAT